FLPAKTKHALGGGIEFKDASVCVHGDDAIKRGIENAAIQHFELLDRGGFAVSGPWFGFHQERAASRETNKFDGERAIALREKRAILTAGMADEEVVGKRRGRLHENTLRC